MPHELQPKIGIISLDRLGAILWQLMRTQQGDSIDQWHFTVRLRGPFLAGPGCHRLLKTAEDTLI